MSGTGPSRGHPEANLQRSIVDLLGKVLPYGAWFHASCHEVRGSSDWARNMQEINKGMGALSGFADLMVCGSGKVLFLEVKTATGRPSEAQMRFAILAEGQGHGYAVVRSTDDVLAALAAHGIAHRNARVMS